jgi:predicted transcriptional regulator
LQLKYEGIFSLRQKDFDLANNPQNKNLKIRDFADYSVPSVTPEEKLSKALDIIMRHDIDKVAVTDKNFILGYIRSKDIFEAYTLQLKSKKDVS